jgi:ATP-binding cassette subfamily B protein
MPCTSDECLVRCKSFLKIANTLVLYGTQIENAGIVNGKMGITFFLFHYALTPYKKAFGILFFIMLIATGLQALLPFISKAVIDTGIYTQDIDFIYMMLIGNIVLLLSVTLSNILRDWVLLHVSTRVNISLISDYLIKLMKLPVTFFENKLVGDILQRAYDHERIRSFVMNNSLGMVFSCVTFLVFSAILLVYNPGIFFIFIAGSVLFVAWILIFLSVRKKLDWEYFDLNAKNQSFWVETVGNVQEIKINNYEDVKRWKWEGIQARMYHLSLKVLKVNNAQSLGAQFINSMTNLGVTFYCAVAVIRGDITFGVMISTQFIIGMLNGPVAQLVGFIQSLQYAKISVKKYLFKDPRRQGNGDSRRQRLRQIDAAETASATVFAFIRRNLHRRDEYQQHKSSSVACEVRLGDAGRQIV